MATQTAIELETPQPVTVHEVTSPVVRDGHSQVQEPNRIENPAFSKARTVIVVIHLLGLSLFSSFSNGIIVVGLPAITETLKLSEALLLWPASVFYLTAGSTLLLAGSVADAAGPKSVNMAGAALGAAFTLGCGLAQSGGELIAFRALQGIANAIIVPSSISIISTNVKDGRPRNLGFACLGLAAPVGFSLGLVLGGVFIDGIGWRPAFYFVGTSTGALFLGGFWALPRDRPRSAHSIWTRLVTEIDWIGAVVATTGLATFSYIFAMLSADISNIHNASSISLLTISITTIPAFIGWMHYRAKRNRTALMPNTLWKSLVFTSSCIMVLFATSVTNCMELYSSLFFQEVQSTSALGASLRILPSLIAGALINLFTGLFVNRIPVMWSVLATAVLSAVAPLLMAVIGPAQSYWHGALFAQILAPLSCDVLFTVGLLVISDVFPPHMQALSGAVFNTCAQLGTAIGLSVTSIISRAIAHGSGYADVDSPGALLAGYRAVFWTLFAWMILVALVTVPGLWKVGHVGLKRD
ncbi:MFS general substrate transporter [Xylaria bambusicola]|uniref:MFS general substrate transporter n=1 Tax=Xylaria bambusicola TaxID=326684 RepID=UPI002007E5B4|nr:MFS general substrate transporter [Xylaria bambusicola]KAI0505163.1 MFS general substrate transporter [Xylaria bambusicola]